MQRSIYKKTEELKLVNTWRIGNRHLSEIYRYRQSGRERGGNSLKGRKSNILGLPSHLVRDLERVEREEDRYSETQTKGIFLTVV